MASASPTPAYLTLVVRALSARDRIACSCRHLSDCAIQLTRGSRRLRRRGNRCLGGDCRRRSRRRGTGGRLGRARRRPIDVAFERTQEPAADLGPRISVWLERRETVQALLGPCVVKSPPHELEVLLVDRDSLLPERARGFVELALVVLERLRAEIRRPLRLAQRLAEIRVDFGNIEGGRRRDLPDLVVD